MSALQNCIIFNNTQPVWNTAADVENVIEALNKNNTTTCLILQMNSLSPDAAYAIANALEQHKQLRELTMNNVFDGRSRFDIAQSMTCFTKSLIKAGIALYKLDMSHNILGRWGAMSLTKLLESAVCYSLQELHLQACHIDVYQARFIAEALYECFNQAYIKHIPFKLRVLNLSHNRIEECGIRCFSVVLFEMGTIEVLNLANTHLYLDAFKLLPAILLRNNGIREIKLSHNVINPSAAKLLADAFYKMHSLTLIELKYCNLDGKSAVQITTALSIHKNLTHLDLSYNQLDRKAGLKIIDMLIPTSLQIIELYGNKFGTLGRKLITDRVRKGREQLLLTVLIENVTEGGLDLNELTISESALEECEEEETSSDVDEVSERKSQSERLTKDHLHSRFFENGTYITESKKQYRRSSRTKRMHIDESTSLSALRELDIELKSKSEISRSLHKLVDEYIKGSSSADDSIKSIFLNTTLNRLSESENSTGFEPSNVAMFKPKNSSAKYCLPSVRVMNDSEQECNNDFSLGKISDNLNNKKRLKRRLSKKLSCATTSQSHRPIDGIGATQDAGNTSDEHAEGTKLIKSAKKLSLPKIHKASDSYLSTEHENEGSDASQLHKIHITTCNSDSLSSSLTSSQSDTGDEKCFKKSFYKKLNSTLTSQLSNDRSYNNQSQQRETVNDKANSNKDEICQDAVEKLIAEENLSSSGTTETSDTTDSSDASDLTLCRRIECTNIMVLGNVSVPNIKFMRENNQSSDSEFKQACENRRKRSNSLSSLPSSDSSDEDINNNKLSCATSKHIFNNKNHEMDDSITEDSEKSADDNYNDTDNNTDNETDNDVYFWKKAIAESENENEEKASILSLSFFTSGSSCSVSADSTLDSGGVVYMKAVNDEQINELVTYMKALILDPTETAEIKDLILRFKRLSLKGSLPKNEDIHKEIATMKKKKRVRFLIGEEYLKDIPNTYFDFVNDKDVYTSPDLGYLWPMDDMKMLRMLEDPNFDEYDDNTDQN